MAIYPIKNIFLLTGEDELTNIDNLSSVGTAVYLAPDQNKIYIADATGNISVIGESSDASTDDDGADDADGEYTNDDNDGA